MPSKKPDGPPFLEIQVHPSDIRRGVWYFFLTRKQFRLSLAGLAGVALFLLVNLALVPRVTGNLLGRRHYESLVSERARQGERLQTLVDRLSTLRDSTDELHLRMSRIYLAYGLESDESGGQGGFPFETPPVPDSIYDRAIRQGGLLQSKIQEQLGVLETFIGEVQSFESAHSDQVQTTPSTSPLRGASFVLTSPFGTRRSPFTKKMDFHPGIDLAAPIGTPIHAPADGVVVYSGRFPLRQSVSWWRYGNLVALKHGDGFVSLFGHCDKIDVRNGQQVKQGEVIATVGNTGWSTSPHLHYEVRSKNAEGTFEPIDPRVYILDHKWRDEDRLLVQARRAPSLQNYEPLPRIIGR